MFDYVIVGAGSAGCVLAARPLPSHARGRWFETTRAHSLLLLLLRLEAHEAWLLVTAVRSGERVAREVAEKL